MKDDPIPKSLQDGPKEPEPEKIDGWFRAALKRCWPRPEATEAQKCKRDPVGFFMDSLKEMVKPRPRFKLRHERPWHPWAYRMIALHIDQATPGGLR